MYTIVYYLNLKSSLYSVASASSKDELVEDALTLLVQYLHKVFNNYTSYEGLNAEQMIEPSKFLSRVVKGVPSKVTWGAHTVPFKCP